MGEPPDRRPARRRDRHAIFRLGDELSVRLPRRPAPSRELLDKEFEWLPKLAPLLPLAIPTPVTRGVPGNGYPHEWAIYSWLDGEDATSADLDLPRAAVDLAEFLAALRRIDPTGGPPPPAAAARSVSATRPRAPESLRSPTRSTRPP